MNKQAMRILLVTTVVGMLFAGALHAETVAERFEKNLKEIAAACAKRKLARNEVCGEVTKLKPADPLATEEGRFAHSITIPNPLPADSGYKPGMTSQEYFDHLCKTEAGEFIYKTVENVEGLYMMRPRKEATDDELSHLYALEDPYGHVMGSGSRPEEYFVQPAIGKYQFLESPLPLSVQVKEGVRYRRYYRDEKAHPGRDYPTAINGKFVRVPYVVAVTNVPSLLSRYGYTWRGIVRPHDRELGIAGGELIILDLQTNEVLAVRRSFAKTGSVRNNLTSIWWLTAGKCSKESLKTEAQFINQVLKAVTSSAAKEK